MYQVTQDFLNKVKANERRIYAKCQIDYTDPFLDQSIQCTANEQANVSYPAQTADAVTEPVGKIASLDGTWVLGEDWVLAPGADEIETKQMGWWGSQLAGADGSFVTPYPTLTVTFFSRPITQLKVVGDSKRDEYPVDFDINLYDTNGTILYTETVTDNTQITWQKTLDNPITQITKMDLVVKKWSHAGRQAKILEFFTSIQETYEGDDILLIHLLEEREVSQGSLPVGNISSNEIDIRLNNASRKFDAGNKQSSLYQLLKQNRRIKAWLGLKGDGDGVNIQQSVDFNQGTLNNLIVVNNKLQLPSVDAPTFSRNSIAYLSDGTLVNSNLPRFEQGAFAGDKVLIIEEGTTNLLGSASKDFSLWTLNTGATRILNADIAPDGTQTACKVIGLSSAYGERITKTILEGVSISGKTYTGSIYVKAGEPNDIGKKVIVYVKRSIGTDSRATKEITLTNSWQRVTGSFTGKSDNTGVTMAIARYDANPADTILIWGAQIEQKPYATSFVDGTRQSEIFNVPTTGILNPQEGAIEAIVRLVNPTTTNYTKHTIINAGLLSWNDGSKGDPNGFSLAADYSNKWRFTYGIGNNNAISLYSTSSWQTDVNTFLTVKYGNFGAKLYVNGVLENSSSYIPNFIFEFCKIGCGNTYFLNTLNGVISDLRISNIARTDAEIQQAYQNWQAGQKLPVDEWTTYKLNFDNNLNFGQGGYYISPEFDLSAVGTAATSAISWQEDADGIQRTVYAKLDNQTNWVEVINGGKLPINAGDLLTGRKLQLKTKLLKVV